MRALLTIMVAGCLGTAPAHARQTLALGGSGHWKYLTFDPATQDLFIAQGDEITVVDTAAMRIRGHVTGLSGAHGVALAPGGHGYASSSKSASLSVFDPATRQVSRVLKADDDANSVTYDPVSKRVFVANDDSGSITVVDTAKDTVIATIALPGGEGLQSAVADGRGHLFVNHSARNEVIRIDTRTAAADAAWPLAGCTGPQGLAADDASKRLFISCANGHLLVLDQQDGRPVATLPIGPDSGTVLFDARLHRLYTPNADGTLSVIKQSGADDFTLAPPIATAKGARTAALNPRTGVIYLVTADIDAAAPASAGRRHEGYAFKSGTARLVVVDPSRP